MGCYGDGGAIFTDNDEYADVLKSIRVHGSGKNKYDNVRVGINGRLDTVQAAVLEKLDIFDNELSKGKSCRNYYKEFISNKYIFQYISDGYKSANAIFSVLAKSLNHRDKILSKFKEKNIPIMVYYHLS